MIKDFVDSISIDREEVLRYLEYKGQDIDNNIIEIIEE